MPRYALALACIILAPALPAHAASPELPMQVTVHPNPMSATTTSAYVEVVTQPRIVCVAFVLFDNGMLPFSFPHAATQVTSYGGVAIWEWSGPPRAAGGTASVSCTSAGVTRTVNVHFRVLPAATPRPPVRDAPFAVHAAISPASPRRGSTATLSARTAPGARCVAGVFYNDGAAARSFVGYPQTATGGVVSWRWHVDTASTGGTATVTCALGRDADVATVLFAVTRP